MNNKDNVFIYTAKINFNISDADFQNALELLTQEEQKSIILKKNYKYRCQSLISILLMKRAIKDTLGLTENCFKIKRNNMNRPYIETNEEVNIDFNISHSNEWVICAISKIGKVGVDIEEIIPIDINIGKEFLSKDEFKYLHTYAGKKINLFYKFWTLKESFLKAVGVGINDSIKEINFGELDTKSSIFRKEINKEIWSFYNIVFEKKYFLSLATNKLITNISFNNYKKLYNLNC